MAIFKFVHIASEDSPLTGESFSFGALMVGLESFKKTIMVENTTSQIIQKCQIFLDSAKNYNGSHTQAIDVSEILVEWPKQMSKTGKKCGFYLYKYPYDSTKDITDDSNWILFEGRGSSLKAVTVPMGCVQGSTSDGYVPGHGIIQLVLKFVVPNQNAFSSLKCARICLKSA